MKKLRSVLVVLSVLLAGAVAAAPVQAEVRVQPTTDELTGLIVGHERGLTTQAWSGWESLGGYLTTAPTAVSWSNGRIDVFGRGSDNALYHKWFDGGWSGWESLGGTLTSGPGASSWASGRLDLFVRGTDNAMYHKWFQSGWSGWESLGGGLISGPAAVSWGNNRIDTFVIGGDNALYHKWWA